MKVVATEFPKKFIKDFSHGDNNLAWEESILFAISNDGNTLYNQRFLSHSVYFHDDEELFANYLFNGSVRLIYGKVWQFSIESRCKLFEDMKLISTNDDFEENTPYYRYGKAYHSRFYNTTKMSVDPPAVIPKLFEVLHITPATADDYANIS